jgi:pimeloyl-ACP methyl ester carboxylesterase
MLRRLLVGGVLGFAVVGATAGAASPVGHAWTLHGEPLPQGVIGPGRYRYGPLGRVFDLRSGFEQGLLSPETQAARIPVRRIEGPVLLISGGDDQLWPSKLYADQIMAGLRSDPAVHEHLNYPAAGHTVLWFPNWPTPIVFSSNGALIALGRTPAADNAAHVRDWPAMVAFIEQH